MPADLAGQAPRRLFVAAWLSEAAREALEDLPRPSEPGVRWVPPEHWHVTLRFLGRADPAVADEALRGLTAAAARAQLGPAVSRLGRAILCVPVTGLDDLAQQVRDATAHVGKAPDPRPFNGHVTLARLRRRGSCGLAGHRISVEMAVDEIALVDSVTHSQGARYTTLATYRLG